MNADSDRDRFSDCQIPEVEDGKPTEYNWIVQNIENFRLGYKTDIGAFTYINAKDFVTIEDLAQIGSHSVVLPGVTVGENAVIGAFSLVNQDIPANSIAMGVPAKVVKYII